MVAKAVDETPDGVEELSPVEVILEVELIDRDVEEKTIGARRENRRR